MSSLPGVLRPLPSLRVMAGPPRASGAAFLPAPTFWDFPCHYSSQAPAPSQASRQLGSPLDGACMRAGVRACPRPPGLYRAACDTEKVLDTGTRV